MVLEIICTLYETAGSYNMSWKKTFVEDRDSRFKAKMPLEVQMIDSRKMFIIPAADVVGSVVDAEKEDTVVLMNRASCKLYQTTGSFVLSLKKTFIGDRYCKLKAGDKLLVQLVNPRKILITPVDDAVGTVVSTGVDADKMAITQ